MSTLVRLTCTSTPTFPFLSTFAHLLPTMRFLHTADWHLGRLLHGVHLTDDQAHLLDQFLTLVRDVRPDAVIVAGDIYDRAVPPKEAVALLNDVLQQLVVDLDVPVIMNAGNHDSAERLHFGSAILENQGLHIYARPGREAEPVVLHDAHGPVHVYPLPYAEPAEMRQVVPDAEITTHDDVVRVQTARARAGHPPNTRAIGVAHIFAQGGDLSDTERPLSVGGSEQVAAAHFDGFDYVALGHLHRRQKVGASHIRYSGSLMKYSFNEVAHEKSVYLVEMDAAGDCTVETIPLTPRRDLRKIEGTLDEVLTGPKPGESADDYLWVDLKEEGPVLDAMNKIRSVYPNTLHIQRPRADVSRTIRGLEEEGGRLKSDTEIFELFFKHVTGADGLSDEQRTTLSEALDAIRTEARDA